MLKMESGNVPGALVREREMHKKNDRQTDEWIYRSTAINILALFQWLRNVQNETIALSLPADSKTHGTLMKACHCGWIPGMMR